MLDNWGMSFCQPIPRMFENSMPTTKNTAGIYIHTWHMLRVYIYIHTCNTDRERYSTDIMIISMSI